MTQSQSWFGLLCLLAICGCAPLHPLVLEQPVGPEAMAAADRDAGALVVYSTNEPNPDDSPNTPHTNYDLRTADGTFVRHVLNQSGAFGWKAATLPLPAGRYRVVATASYYGLVDVPVVIEAGRTTVVDLNRESPARGRTAAAAAVRLPSGRVVGGGAVSAEAAAPKGP